MINDQFNYQLFRLIGWGLLSLSLWSCQPQQIKQNHSISPNSFPTKSKEEILEEVYNRQDELKFCQFEMDVSISQSASSVYQINDGIYLVQIVCFLGAYQANYEYLRYSLTPSPLNSFEVKIEPLTFTTIKSDKSGNFFKTKVTSIAGLSNYNRQKQLLTIYTKYRGLGDCGSLVEYQWKDSSFDLVEYREKEDCDGTYIEQENYPLIYPLSIK